MNLTVRPTLAVLVSLAVAGGAAALFGAGPAAARQDTETLRGTVAIEFPSWNAKGANGCLSSPGGPAPKLKKGKKVVVYEGVAQPDETLELSDDPIATGRVGKGKINDDDNACEFTFKVKNAPVIDEANSYVIEIRGVAEVKYVPAATVVDGDLGVILTLER